MSLEKRQVCVDARADKTIAELLAEDLNRQEMPHNPYQEGVGQHLDTLERLKHTVSKLSVGDVLQHKKYGNKVIILSDVNIPGGVCVGINVNTRQSHTYSIIDVAKHFNILLDIDQNGYPVHDNITQEAGDQIADYLDKKIEELKGKIRAFEDKKKARSKQKVTVLTDVLKKGEWIRYKNPSELKQIEKYKDQYKELSNVKLLVLFRDHITKYYTLRKGIDGKEVILSYDDINGFFTRVPKPPAPKTPPRKELRVFRFTQTIEKEIFVPMYSETRRDRNYVKYCERRGRDVSRQNIGETRSEFVWKYDDLLKWLGTNLTDSQKHKLTFDLKKTIESKKDDESTTKD